MAIMNRQDLVTRRPPGHREGASTMPGERTTQPAAMPSIMQPSMQANKPLGNQAPTMRGPVQSGPSPATTVSAQASAATAAPGQPPTTTTSERTHSILAQDSPLMRQAATRGRQYAHERGLLNSSLAAGAAQGAVLDRGIELGRADADDAYKSFYAGLDMKRFESDENYRNDALDQEKQLQERKIALDERVADSSIGIEEERLDFDKDRFRTDSAYRDRVLAQENKLQTERLTFDRERFSSDNVYRDRVLGQEKELSDKRLNFDKDRFRTDSAYRQKVLAQENDLQTRRLDLAQEENEFRRTFDRERFESDDTYRGEVLSQEASIANRRADIAIEQLGINRDTLTQNAHTGLRNTFTQLNGQYQATVAGTMANPDLTAAQRDSALAKAKVDHNAARTDAANLSGPAVPITWVDPDLPPPPPPPGPGVTLTPLPTPTPAYQTPIPQAPPPPAIDTGIYRPPAEGDNPLW